MSELQTVDWRNEPASGVSRRRIRVTEPPIPSIDQSSGSGKSTQTQQQRTSPVSFEIVVPEATNEALVGNTRETVRNRTPRRGAVSSQRRSAVRFWLLNKWQGRVLAIGSDTFQAELFDLAHPNIIEHAEFPLSELPADGRALLRPGAVFYWMIGYRDEGTRQRTRESIIWMRRSGIMGADKFKAALESVNRTWAAFDDAVE